MAKAAHVATVFGVMICVGCQATTSSPACLASEEPRSESGSSSRASMLLQVARSRDSSDSKPVTMDERDSSPVTRDLSDSKPVVRSRDSTPVTMGELLQHTEPLQSKLDDLNLKVTKLETDFGRNRGEDSKEKPNNDVEKEERKNNMEKNVEKKGGKNSTRTPTVESEYKDMENKVAKDAKNMPTMEPRRNRGEDSEEVKANNDEEVMGNNEEEPTMEPNNEEEELNNEEEEPINDEEPTMEPNNEEEEPNNEEKEPNNEEVADVEKKVGENARRRRRVKKNEESTTNEGGEMLKTGEDWAWVDHKNEDEDVERLKKGEECCDYPGNIPNKHCKTTCGHGLLCVFVGDEVGPPTCVEEEFDKRSLANVPNWDGVAPRAWNGLEKVNTVDQGDNASWKGKGRGVASGRPYSGEYPYDTLMDVDFIIDSNPPWPSRNDEHQAKLAPRRNGAKSRREAKVAAKTSPRDGAKSSSRNAAKSSPRSGAKSSPLKESKQKVKSSARSGAKTSPTDKKSRKAPKGGDARALND